MDYEAEVILTKMEIIVDSRPTHGKISIGEIIHTADSLLVRSKTTATKGLIAKATNLKVIGRAGIGVDNIDVPASTTAGITVMNTPFANATSTAEHTIALMLSIARLIPQANTSTHAGKWKKIFLYGKPALREIAQAEIHSGTIDNLLWFL